MYTGKSVFVGTGSCGRFLLNRFCKSAEINDNILILDSDMGEMKKHQAFLPPQTRCVYVPPVRWDYTDRKHAFYKGIEIGFSKVVRELKFEFSQADTVYIFTGLGRPAGSVLSSKVAELSGKLGIRVVTFAVLPFKEEGARINELAKLYSERLQQASAVFTSVSHKAIHATNRSGSPILYYYYDISQLATANTQAVSELFINL